MAITFNHNDQVYVKDGKLGIGTASPSQKLEVTGNVKVGDGSADNYVQSVFSDGSETRMHGYGFYMSRTNSYIRPTNDGAQILAIGTDNHTWNYVAIDANYFTISTNASEHLRVTNAGNVGIGTTAPSSKFEVYDSANSNTFTITSDGANEQFRIRRYSNTNEQLIIGFHSSDYGYIQTVEQSVAYRPLSLNPNGGNVGIGTTSPSAKLHINGFSTGAGLKVQYGNSVGTIEAVNFIANGGANGVIGMQMVSAGVGDLWLGGSGGRSLTLYRDGNVGIGTTSPSAKLDVASTVAKIAEFERIGSANYDLTISDLGAGAAQLWFNANTNDTGFLFRPKNSSGTNVNALMVDPTGNVGIGTTSPENILHIQSPETTSTSNAYINIFAGHQAAGGSDNDGEAGLIFRHYAGSSTYYRAGAIISAREQNYSVTSLADSYLRFETAENNINSERMRITSGGNVGIGTTAPGSKLDVVGNESNYAAIFRNSTTTGYAPGSILLQSGQSASRGQGVYHYNIQADEAWFTGVPYNVDSKKWIVANKLDTTFNPDVAQLSHALMTIDSDTGNVGIGTDSPGAKLHAKSSGNGTYILRGMSSAGTDLGGLYQSTAGDGEIYLKTSAVTTNVRISSNNVSYLNGGNVGIGTTSPTAKLNIGSAYDDAFVLTDGRTASNTSTFNSSIVWDAFYSDAAKITLTHNDYNTTYRRLHFDIGGNELMSIKANGNVGIGTDSPAATLHISKGSNNSPTVLRIENVDTTIETAQEVNTIQFYTNDGSTSGTGITSKIVQVAENPGNQYGLSFYTYDLGLAEALRITNDGNVGIGTTSPAGKLSIKSPGDVDTYGDAFVLERAGTTAKLIRMYEDAADGFLEVRTGNDNIVTKLSGYSGTASYFLSNVGIGTTSPAYKLHVVGGSTYAALLDSDQDYTLGLARSGTPEWWLKTYTDGRFAIHENGVGDKVTIKAGGNVGIGTTSPFSKLHIDSNTPSAYTNGFRDGELRIANDNSSNIANQTSNIVLSATGWAGSTTGVAQLSVIQDGSNVSNGTFTIKVRDNGTHYEAFRIKHNGNVGIGTTNPLDPLNVQSTGASDYAFRIFRSTSTTQGLAGFYEGSANQGQLYLLKGDNTAGVLLNSSGDSFLNGGNVGIGTTSPSQKLDVNGDIAVKGVSIINKASAALVIGDIAGTDSVTNLTLSTAGRSTEVFLDDSGNVGVNTTTPSYNLTVDSGTNDIGIVTASSDSGSYIGFIDNSTTVATMPKVGAVGNKLILDASQYVGVRRTDPSYALDVSGTIRATGDVIAYSDARVKENVETIPNALDKVKAMRGVGYNKIGEEKRSIGVIAQEMLDVIPEVVHTDDQGMHSVAYGNLVGVLIEAMKEQQQQIDELKALIASK